MILPLPIVAASALRRPSSSLSSSSSDHSPNGFLAPPASVFLTTRRTIASSIFVLAAPPGGLSKNCLTRREENPLVPPKYSMSLSSSSELWGMFCPPVVAALTNDVTAPTSMSRSVDACCALRLPRILSARQRRHRMSREPSLRRLKCSALLGKILPQSVQGLLSLVMRKGRPSSVIPTGAPR